jgi:glucosamine 6-phosphate synthetase-like amidotransferase/phosphosugar isomerase protein
MNKMDFDSALRRQVMSLPELMRQQYADLEPKTRTVLSTPEIFNIQRIVLTGCGDSYAALLAVKPAFEKYAKIRTEVVPTIDLARDYEKKNLGYAPQSPLVIAVSNSGQVARVGEAVRRCRKAGAFTLGITGHEESVLGQSAERILKLDIPKFESAPGTRSYMVCVMALYLLAIRIGEVRGRYTMDVASARRKEIKALADALDAADIAVRAGLHCAPAVHAWLGTLQSGAIRFSPGLYNTAQEMDDTALLLARLLQA